MTQLQKIKLDVPDYDGKLDSKAFSDWLFYMDQFLTGMIYQNTIE